ncbi:Microcin-D immunity protein [Serratia entomophila]|uniref:Colicin-D n=1 Tax=Serratia entomophila TaxID=42906 RepID=A0ABY5CVX9_9GAMM|nr:colicin immunity domain-containing protein [Serratia entomophila]UIW18817.1 colicin-D [Serratia entomophila]USV01472.1 colicin-D [Serratia entomophila]CAI0773498.1 Microcin-D immunity protein [Serratia entomophila]CAI0779042.1 Microcin-D immunity protein [Serratia entomophila]CAI0801903.1 Microcin-D immunity protein [Serratia entomophila]
MSKKLTDLAKEFVSSSIDANKFADPYISMWKAERDMGKLSIDGKDVDEASSTIFCLADCYNPDSDRENYELDEAGLRKEVKATLEKFKLL